MQPIRELRNALPRDGLQIGERTYHLERKCVISLRLENTFLKTKASEFLQLE